MNQCESIVRSKKVYTLSHIAMDNHKVITIYRPPSYPTYSNNQPVAINPLDHGPGVDMLLLPAISIPTGTP